MNSEIKNQRFYGNLPYQIKKLTEDIINEREMTKRKKTRSKAKGRIQIILLLILGVIALFLLDKPVRTQNIFKIIEMSLYILLGGVIIFKVVKTDYIDKFEEKQKILKDKISKVECKCDDNCNCIEEYIRYMDSIGIKLY